MSALVLAIAPVLVAVFVMIAGNGLMNTLVPLRATLEGFAASDIGLIGSAYFFGMLAGTWTTPIIVRHAGHVRAFAAYAAVVAVAALFFPLFVSPIPWMLARGLVGFCFAGLYAIVESWISVKAGPTHRGRMLGLYNIANFSGSAFGQQTLRVIDAKDFGAFSAAASFLMLSLIPMAVTKAEPPPLPPKGQLRIGELYRSSMISIVTIILLGFANGSFWSIVPAYVEHLQMGPGTVASFMTAVIIGSALSPYPVGRMSDKFDRRIVIAVASGLAMIFEIAMAFSHTTTPIVLYALGFSIGATIPVLYPLVSALSVDRLGAEKAVSVASTLLFLYCIGAIVGPVLAATMMTAFGDAMLFAQNAIAHAIITGFIILRLRHERAAPQHQRDATPDELPPQ